MAGANSETITVYVSGLWRYYIHTISAIFSTPGHDCTSSIFPIFFRYTFRLLALVSLSSPLYPPSCFWCRCMFLHHLRLRYAAIGFQLLWRGYYVRTRYRVKEKVHTYHQKTGKNKRASVWPVLLSVYPLFGKTEKIVRLVVAQGVRRGQLSVFAPSYLRTVAVVPVTQGGYTICMYVVWYPAIVAEIGRKAGRVCTRLDL